MLRRVVVLGLIGLAGLAVFACTDGSGDSGAAADSITQRQRDSVIGESGIPGARAIRSAQKASDALDERSARLDSLEDR